MSTSEMDRRCRRRTAPAASPASLPEADDLIREILIRLPPRPSSLPRASLVCKQWRRLVTDPQFLARFRAHHHNKPPLLGFFVDGRTNVAFVPALDPPDRIPPSRFSMPPDEGHEPDGFLMDCRHGLVLFLNRRRRRRLLVWDPVAGEQRHVALPPELEGEEMLIFNGAVLCPDQDRRPRRFQVAVVAADRAHTRLSACLYSSEAGAWGGIISLPFQAITPLIRPSTLIGDSVCWLLATGNRLAILEFHLDRERLVATELPPDSDACRDSRRTCIMPAEDGLLRCICVSLFRTQQWRREALPDHGAPVWVPEKTIKLDELLSIRAPPTLLGFVEDSNAILVRTFADVFMLYLQSMEFEKLPNMKCFSTHYPFASFYPAAGNGTGDDGHGGAQVLQNYSREIC